jgi:peroxiredoxin
MTQEEMDTNSDSTPAARRTVRSLATTRRRLTPRQWRMLIALTVVLGVIWIVVSRVPLDSIVQDKQVVAPATGFLAPDFTLDALDGEQVRLSSLRGQPVIINFWATWCPPCRAEMPELEKAWQKYQEENLVLLGVDQAENVTVVSQFARRKMGVTFPILLDKDLTVRNAYAVRALPTTIFIDTQGRIQDVKIGGPLDQASIVDGVNKILER